MSGRKYDAVVVGSGPNGMSAALEIARSGRSVCVLEANEQVGGGARTAELTEPGFRHDICSAMHPMAVLSPFFTSLDLEDEGLEWIESPLALTHSLDGHPTGRLSPSIRETAAWLDED